MKKTYFIKTKKQLIVDFNMFSIVPERSFFQQYLENVNVHNIYRYLQLQCNQKIGNKAASFVSTSSHFIIGNSVSSAQP